MKMRIFTPAISALMLGSLIACSPQGGQDSQQKQDDAELPSGHWQMSETGSSLRFVSIKAGNVAEVSKFDKFSGTITETGEVQITIDLTSVNTAIAQRDERMRNRLFEIGTFPTATVTASIDLATWQDLSVGERRKTTQPITIELHGESQKMEAPLTITRIAQTRVLVETDGPLILDVASFGMEGGVEKLRELAGLPSISLAVPVSASLFFALEPGTK